MKTRIALLAAFVCMVCAGCAGVPTGGRVAPLDANPAGVTQDQPHARNIPVPPNPAWGPEQLVDGFLTAAGSFDDGQRTARLYLRPGVVWLPESPPEVFVTDQQPQVQQVVQTSGGGYTVRVQANQVGVITEQGQYQATTPAKAISEDFQVTKDNHGEWRIAGMPIDFANVVMLSRHDMARAFLTRNLYYFAPDYQVLVPNPVYLPNINRADLPAQIVKAELKGPGDWLGQAVQNAFPAKTQLLGDRVDVTADGTATINLSRDAATGDRRRMAAQLVWTFLQSVPEVKRIRLEINGVTVAPVGMDDVLPVNQQTWDYVGPDAALTAYAQSSSDAFVQDKTGHLATFTPTSGREPVPVPALANVRVSRPAISIDRTQVAWLSEQHDQVLAADMKNTASIHTVLRARPGSTFTQPSWDRYGNLWVVESAASASWLWLEQPGKAPVQADNWEMSVNRVLAFRVALDGVRVAAIVINAAGKGEIQVGRIGRDPNGRPSAGYFLHVSTSVVDASDLAWRDADDLAVLGKAEGGVLAPYDVSVTGAGVSSAIGTGNPSGLATIAAAPLAPVLTGVRAQSSAAPQLCWLRDFRGEPSDWACERSGADPVYPG